ncbi:MAG TPA: hypothetical protein VGF09_04290 [Solirubrobacterales bacterium]|jgi:hypothetical protein
MLNWLKRSGHATAVAYLALFLALGGGAMAVAGGVKINGGKLKQRSVSGKSLKKHTITGTEVNLNRLGKVPSAKAADTATTAKTADVAGGLATMTTFRSTRITSSANGATVAAALEAAQPVRLYEDSHFMLYGKCVTDEASGLATGVLYIATKQNGAIFDGEEDELPGGLEKGGVEESFLNTNSPEDEREVERETAAKEEANIQESEDFAATAADGYSITGPWQLAVKHGALPQGGGAYGAGDVCLFAGYVLHS